MRHSCYRSQLRARQGPPGLLHPDCTDMFAAASPLVEGMPERGAAYLDSSEELDERRGHPPGSSHVRAQQHIMHAPSLPHRTQSQRCAGPRCALFHQAVLRGHQTTTVVGCLAHGGGPHGVQHAGDTMRSCAACWRWCGMATARQSRR